MTPRLLKTFGELCSLEAEVQVMMVPFREAYPVVTPDGLNDRVDWLARALKRARGTAGSSA